MCPTLLSFQQMSAKLKSPTRTRVKTSSSYLKKVSLISSPWLGGSTAVTLTGLSSASDPHLSPSHPLSLRRAVTSRLHPHVKANCPPNHPCLSFLMSLCSSLTPVVQCPTLSPLLQRCYSLVTTHWAAVPSAGFPGCVHLCPHTWGRWPFALLCSSSCLLLLLLCILLLCEDLSSSTVWYAVSVSMLVRDS